VDSKALVKIEFKIFGRKFEMEMWINWFPDKDYGVDKRVVEWFADCYNEAKKIYDAQCRRLRKEDEERIEKQELARLKAKYES